MPNTRNSLSWRESIVADDEELEQEQEAEDVDDDDVLSCCVCPPRANWLRSLKRGICIH